MTFRHAIRKLKRSCPLNTAASFDGVFMACNRIVYSEDELRIMAIKNNYFSSKWSTHTLSIRGNLNCPLVNFPQDSKTYFTGFSTKCTVWFLMYNKPDCLYLESCACFFCRSSSFIWNFNKELFSPFISVSLTIKSLFTLWSMQRIPSQIKQFPQMNPLMSTDHKVYLSRQCTLIPNPASNATSENVLRKTRFLCAPSSHKFVRRTRCIKVLCCLPTDNSTMIHSLFNFRSILPQCEHRGFFLSFTFGGWLLPNMKRRAWLKTWKAQYFYRL